jgi:hypothetical protein
MSGISTGTSPGSGGGSSSVSPYVFASGKYYGAPVTVAAGALTNQRLSAIEWPVPVATTFDRIGFHVTTAAASTTIRLGIYGTTAGLPDALVLDAGTIDSSTTGGKEITISQALPAGVYWLAALVNGAALQGIIMSAGNAPGIGETSVANWSNGVGGYFRDGVTGNLPANFGAVTQVRTVPVPILRAA